jgi:3-phenylpropionate/cinnamic acid dioxygenase small subunit
MLQETINNWRTYHNLYDSLEKWLNEGEHILRRSSEEKLVSKKTCLPLKSK